MTESDKINARQLQAELSSLEKQISERPTATWREIVFRAVSRVWFELSRVLSRRVHTGSGWTPEVSCQPSAVLVEGAVLFVSASSLARAHAARQNQLVNELIGSRIGMVHFHY